MSLFKGFESLRKLLRMNVKARPPQMLIFKRGAVVARINSRCCRQ